jgi:hypothetical protein
LADGFGLLIRFVGSSLADFSFQLFSFSAFQMRRCWLADWFGLLVRRWIPTRYSLLTTRYFGFLVRR